MKKITSQSLCSSRDSLRLLGSAGALALLGGNGEWVDNGLAAAQPLAPVAPETLPALVRAALFPASAPAPIVRAASSLSCVVKPSQTGGPIS